MPHPIGYIRVSSEEQAQHGISVDAQRDILKAWAVMKQAGEIEIYEDPGFSGKNTNRPALQRMLDAVRRGEADHLVVWKLDRLSRSLRDTLTIIEDVLTPNGVTLVSVTESIDTATPSGRMMLNILASFAQLEREQDSDRVLMAHRHLAEDCRYLGGHIPLGYRVDETKHYQVEPVTAAIVHRAFEMYLARCGYTEILRMLNETVAAFARRKTEWKKSDLNYLLSNEMYAGIYVRKLGKERVRVPGGIPAILSKEEWASVCEQREANRKAQAAYSARRVYPLTGLVHCAVCGGLMPLNHGGKARDGSPERYYTCKRHCVKPARLEPLEDAVLTAMEELAQNEDVVRQACEIANSYSIDAEAVRHEDLVPIDQQLLEIHRRQAKIASYIARDGIGAPERLMDELRQLEKEEDALEEKRAKLLRPIATYNTDITIDAVLACEGIKKRPREEQRALLQRALSAVEITPDSYRVCLAWHTCGGDDPPPYVCHVSIKFTTPKRYRRYTIRVSKRFRYDA